MFPNEITWAYNVTAKQFQHKQLQKGAKCTHKIHKNLMLIEHFMCVPWRTDVHSDALHETVQELNLYGLTVKINLRHCSRVIYNCATLKSKR